MFTSKYDFPLTRFKEDQIWWDFFRYSTIKTYLNSITLMQRSFSRFLAPIYRCNCCNDGNKVNNPTGSNDLFGRYLSKIPVLTSNQSKKRSFYMCACARIR